MQQKKKVNKTAANEMEMEAISLSENLSVEDKEKAE